MAADLDSRATQVAAAIGVMTPPIKHVSLRVWAMRRGWDVPALDAAIDRAAHLGLLVRAAAGIMPAAAAPVPEPDPEPEPVAVDDAPSDPAEVIAEALGDITCLCTRTAPNPNYGCPVHGGARIDTEETPMDKDQVSTVVAAKLLGISTGAVLQAIAKGALKAKRGGRGVPSIIKRVDVIAYRDARAKQLAASDLLPATPTKRKAAAPRSKALVPAPAPVEATLVELQPAELSDVRALVRIVDRCGVDKAAAWEWLRKLVAA